jgi:thymidine phosphorylase
VVVGIDKLQIARVARLAGAPKVTGAGIDLFARLGDTVAEGDPLNRIYASDPADLAFARHALERASGCQLGRTDQLLQVFVGF